MCIRDRCFILAWQTFRILVNEQSLTFLATAGILEVQAILIIWVTFDPLMYILKGNTPKLSLRWMEVTVLIGMALVTFAVINSEE